MARLVSGFTRRALPLALPVLVAGCRPVPATIEVADPSPDQADPTVFVETESKPPATPPGPSPIAAKYVELYTCWFESPYPYMFEERGEELVIDGRRYGMLMAGISGILYYGDLNACAGRLSGTKPRNYSDIAPLEALANIPATLDDPSLPFATVNPAFVSWARSELLPPGDQLIAGLPAQLAYDRVFQRFFRAMATTAAWLPESRTIESEAKQYLRDVEAGADGIHWLERRYSATIPVNDAYADGTMMTGSMALGFWLRRELDGSLPACWHALTDVLAHYDPVWLRELEQRYPTGFARLEARPDPLPPQPRP